MIVSCRQESLFHLLSGSKLPLGIGNLKNQKHPSKTTQKTLACIHTYTQFTNHIKSENRLLSWTLENKHTFPLHRVVDDCGLFSVLYSLSCGAPGIPFYNTAVHHFLNLCGLLILQRNSQNTDLGVLNVCFA